MENATRPSGGRARSARGVGKLFRVLVVGGIALAGCPTTKTAGKTEKPDGQTAGAQPSSPPPDSGGVQGW